LHSALGNKKEAEEKFKAAEVAKAADEKKS